MRLALPLSLIVFSLIPSAHAGHGFEVGAGWQNMGAIANGLHWIPALGGSRKDVPAYLGWRWIGASRVYWAPAARLNYTNFWSLGGAGNLLGVTLAPAGLGVYLTRPPAQVPRAQRAGRWFATIELTAGVQLGANATPTSPSDPRIPDPDAYRAGLVASKVDPTMHDGWRPGTPMITQQYPLGEYSYALVTAPVTIRAWRMVTERVGAGLFLEGNGLMLEWKIAPAALAEPAYGYNISAGASVIVF